MSRDPVRKAIWYVGAHSREELSLEAIARSCEVSPSHLTRAFAAATGSSLIRYLRARRLADAARALADGAADILTVALDAGYGSHEAFSRAFREQFGQTPEQVRARRSLEQLDLMEALVLNDHPLPSLDAPRIETLPARKLVGIAERHRCDSGAGIPDQWQRFLAARDVIPHRVGPASYGAAYNSDGELWFDYLCATEVSRVNGLSAELTALDIPAGRYAVFTHRGHIAGIRATFAAIWSGWFPSSGERSADGPVIEHYGPDFDSRTGEGNVEIWIPLVDVRSA
jgi:AraC family transcriptional regulator